MGKLVSLGRDGQRQLAGWGLGLDSAGLEGELAVRREFTNWGLGLGAGSGLLLAPGGSCTLGGKVVEFK